jgi:hypothetical protein
MRELGSTTDGGLSAISSPVEAAALDGVNCIFSVFYHENAKWRKHESVEGRRYDHLVKQVFHSSVAVKHVWLAEATLGRRLKVEERRIGRGGSVARLGWVNVETRAQEHDDKTDSQCAGQ